MWIGVQAGDAGRQLGLGLMQREAGSATIFCKIYILNLLGFTENRDLR